MSGRSLPTFYLEFVEKPSSHYGTNDLKKHEEWLWWVMPIIPQEFLDTIPEQHEKLFTNAGAHFEF